MPIRRRSIVSAIVALTAFALLGCGTQDTTGQQTVRSGNSDTNTQNQQENAVMSSGTSATTPKNYSFVHDPSMIREGRTYYVFSTGDPNGKIGNGNIQIRTSTNMKQWKYIGTVFNKKPAWIRKEFPTAKNLWAPDISYYHGLYHLYYAVSTFGSNHSVIALATNKTLNPKSPNYKWVDRGKVLTSVKADNYNAIDPNFISTPSGETWMDFGSFWTGIKMVRLKSMTGKPKSSSPHIYALAQRPKPPDAIEAGYIVYRKPYYYLFTSFGLCCRGVNSTYHIMVGRSKSVTGPYVDKSGKKLMKGGGTEVLNSEGSMIGPGGQSIYKHGHSYYLVYHYYDAKQAGAARLQIRKLSWTKTGWPEVDKPMIAVP